MKLQKGQHHSKTNGHPAPVRPGAKDRGWPQAQRKAGKVKKAGARWHADCGCAFHDYSEMINHTHEEEK